MQAWIANIVAQKFTAMQLAFYWHSQSCLSPDKVDGFLSKSILGLHRCRITPFLYAKSGADISALLFAFCAPQRRNARPDSIHGGIPCNLAPAHFTVHVVQVRLNFALGFAVETNPAWNLSYLAASLCDCISIHSLAASTLSSGRMKIRSTDCLFCSPFL